MCMCFRGIVSFLQQSGRAGRGNDRSEKPLVLVVAQSCVVGEFLLRNHATLLDP